MNQEVWEELNMVISEERIFEGDSVRNLINKENVIECSSFYENAITDKQKGLVIEIFCSDHITPETKVISKAYLNQVEDKSKDKYDLSHQLRVFAVLNLEDGSVENDPDAYLNNVDLRKKAEIPFLD